MAKNLVIYGGSFDPVHMGHITPITQVYKQFDDAQLVLLPCYQQPLKQQSITAAQQRVEMLNLAFEQADLDFTVSTIEIEREGKSFTRDSLIYFKQAYPHSNLFFVVGMDSLYNFQRWKSWRQILELATVVVMCRGGSPFDANLVDSEVKKYLGCGISLFTTDEIAISSTELRQLLKANEDHKLKHQMPLAVLNYIRTHGLYI